MTEQELAKIRAKLEKTSGMVLLTAEEADALIAYIDELHRVLHDLRQEPGWELGQQEERREILSLLWANHDAWQERARAIEEQGLAGIAESTRRTADAFRIAAVLVSERGPAAPHLAPDDLRAENEALRAALRKCAEGLEHAELEGGIGSFAEYLDAARAYLADADR